MHADIQIKIGYGWRKFNVSDFALLIFQYVVWKRKLLNLDGSDHGLYFDLCAYIVYVG